MSKDRRRKHFTCKSEAQKAAIPRSYAKRAANDRNNVSVTIKNRRDKNGGHPHVIVDDIEDNHVSVGITHSKVKGKGHPNYALEINPLGGNEPSYMRRQGTVAPKKDYIEPRSGVMTSKDFDKAKEYGETAKRKYIEKNGKKK